MPASDWSHYTDACIDCGLQARTYGEVSRSFYSDDGTCDECELRREIAAVAHAADVLNQQPKVNP
jgi:hypothetical protein